ncbi:ROK family protein [Bosea psychrotolerans]|uniref:Transcriptional regulator of PTS protein n=1 Tax=Bosea psychrotolerans TaxID=1871628 RepID=A0A2S4M1U6_9HYPH|nr:ROK family protein [Bosea psychrotolerans]POR48683.1 transcriptional regulator of PTS gene [Bosea psychrotolerans]
MALASLDESVFSTAHERDRARIYGLVAAGLAQSRAEAGRLSGLRSTTVSRVVADLVARRLVVESIGETAGRGRPAGVLLANARRIGGSVIHVVSQSLMGALVDLNGQIIAERAVALSAEVDNAAMSRAMCGLAAELKAATPLGMAHAGTVVSLSGLLDLREKRWLMASRWPRMRNLDIQALLDPVAGPVEICRNLDAELRARVARDPGRFSGGTLLLHWGWGIGLAHAVDGEPLAPAGGPFGEIGHWRFSVLGERRCGCGNTACLETGAALWALLPILRGHWPELDEDEADLAERFSSRDLMSVPEIDAAARILARALANACRLLFPQRVIVSGPLVANARLWAHFDALFRAEGAMEGLAVPQLTSVRASQDHEIQGAAAPLLRRATEALLKGPG